MALPKKLKNFNCYNDAQSWLGEVPEVTLPKLMRQLESYRAGGMNGPVKLDLGQKELEAELKLGGLKDQIYKQYATSRVDGILLRFSGAYQEDSFAAVSALEVVMRGRYEEIDPGTEKLGESNDTTVKMALSYYKLTVDGQVLVEIDVVNMIEIVDGVDRIAEQRKAIGLN